MATRTSKSGEAIRGFKHTPDEVDLTTVSDEAFKAEAKRRQDLALVAAQVAAKAKYVADRERTQLIWNNRKALLKLVEHAGGCSDENPDRGFDGAHEYPDHYPAQFCIRCALLTCTENHIESGLFDLHFDTTIHVTARFE